MRLSWREKDWRRYLNRKIGAGVAIGWQTPASGILDRYFFVCQPGIGILRDINGAAVDEAVFAEQILHHPIVVVGVDAQMATLAKSPLDTGGSDAFYCSAAGHAMEDTVWAVIQPGAIFDGLIIRFHIFAEIIKKGSHDLVFTSTDATFSFSDIGEDQRFRGPIGGTPLVRVAICSHELAGMFIKLHENGQFFFS